MMSIPSGRLQVATKVEEVTVFALKEITQL